MAILLQKYIPHMARRFSDKVSRNCFFLWFELGPLVPIKGNINDTAYSDILDNVRFQLCDNNLVGNVP